MTTYIEENTHRIRKENQHIRSLEPDMNILVNHVYDVKFYHLKVFPSFRSSPFKTNDWFIRPLLFFPNPACLRAKYFDSLKDYVIEFKGAPNF